eukprot:gene7818-12291_t
MSQSFIYPTYDIDLLQSLAGNEEKLASYLEEKNEEFERDLKRQILDPLSRAEQRREWYSRDRELRNELLAEIIVENENIEQDINDRTYLAFGEQSYHGTLLSEELKKVQEEMEKLEAESEFVGRTPIFLGQKNQFYDVNYLPFDTEEETLAERRGKWSDIFYTQHDDEFAEKNLELLAYEYIHDPEIYQNPPDPESFNDFDDYEEALVEWQEDTERALGYLQLPRVLGRQKYRPYVLPEGDESNSQKQKELEEQNDVGNVLGKLFNKSEVDETWESQLVPIEPKPEFYSTFEEYELAMLRWSLVCLDVTFVPPHPAQFQKLLGIQMSEQPSFYPIRDIQISESEAKSTLVQENVEAHSEEGVKPATDLGDYWKNMKPEERKPFEDSLTDVLEKNKSQISEIGTYFRTISANFHGTLQEPEINFMRSYITDEKVETENPKDIREWVSFQRLENSLNYLIFLDEYLEAADDYGKKHQLPLIRDDIPQEERESQSYDCPLVVDGKDVLFECADFELAKIIYERLKDPTYRDGLQKVLKKIDYGSRLKKVNSWFHPLETREDHEARKRFLSVHLDTIKDIKELTPIKFTEIFETEAHLDVFQFWLEEKMPNKMTITIKDKQETLKTYKHLLYASSNITNFKSLLSLFHLTTNTLTHSKISAYVLLYCSTHLAAENLVLLIQAKDLTNLRYLALSCSFFEEEPMIIFDYGVDLRSQVDKVFGEKSYSVDDFLSDLMILYYLDCMAVSLYEEEECYEHVYPVLIKYIGSLLDKCVDWMESHPNFLNYDLWTCLSHRSKSVSSLGSFILSFLFFVSHNKKLPQLITNCSIVTRLRDIAKNTKFTHVKLSISRIFPQLRQNQWKTLLIDHYKDSLNVMNDLVHVAEGTKIDTQPPLLASIVFDYLTTSITVKKTDPEQHTLNLINGLVSSDVFNQLLTALVNSTHQKTMHEGTVLGAQFLSKYIKFLICYKKVDVIEDVKKMGFKIFKNKVRGEKTDMIQVSEKNLTDLFDVICISDDRKTSKKNYRLRIALLDTFRYLVKVPGLFKLAKNIKDFWPRLLKLCEDGTNIQFNRNAWRLFYQLIKFHSGVIETLKSSGHLLSFLSLISGTTEKIQTKKGKKEQQQHFEDSETKMTSNILTTNSLHYFSKTFRLTKPKEVKDDDSDDEEEGKRRSVETKIGHNIPAKEVTNGYDRSIQLLSSYVASQSQILKIIDDAFRSGFNGWPFQALTQLYLAFQQQPACSKITQTIRKNQDFKEGLDFFVEIAGDPDD